MKFVRFSLLLLSCSLLFGACVKQDFDTPPDTSKADPNLPVHASIKQISSIGINLSTDKYRQFIGDTTITGVVVADDKSGNYYKQIVIEDTSYGGLVLYMDKSYLYNEYPVGRKVYLKLKGLYIYNYAGIPEIVYSVDAAGKTVPIPSGLISNYLVKASYPDNSVKPRTATIEDIKSFPSAYINTLVTISGVQFDAASQDVPYAAPSSTASATNRTIETCDHSSNVIVRTSGYSNFQPYKTPKGNGTLTAVVSIFGSTLQLAIRDTGDVKMYNNRCN